MNPISAERWEEGRARGIARRVALGLPALVEDDETIETLATLLGPLPEPERRTALRKERRS